MMEKFKVLIGYDGSEYADNAIADLPYAGLPTEADVFVATISEVWVRMPSSYGGVETSYIDKAVTGEAHFHEIAQNCAEKLKEMFPGWSVSFGTAVGSAGGILLSKADEWKPDLIIVGSQSRGALGRFFFGSVAQWLVSNALCSVRVVRKKDDAEDSKINPQLRLIVGVDGSNGSKKAVEEIVRRYTETRCEVRIVSATDFFSISNIKNFDLVEPSSAEQDAFYQQERKKVEDAVNQAFSQLDKTNFSVSSVIKNENPKDLIIEQAKEWNADCIFVGARGLSRIERIFVGSVSSAVAARAHCSVEVVRQRL